MRPQRQSKYAYMLMFTIMSCVAGFDAYRTWQAGKRTLSWKPVDGRVTLREQTGTESPSFRIRIEYDVDGGTYHLVTEDQLVTRDQITVYYDPNRPEDAVVTPGVRISRFAPSAMAMVVGRTGFLTNLALAIWPGLETEDSKYDGGPY